MDHDFYDSQEYRTKQGVLMKENWRKGIFDFHYRKEKRKCKRRKCNNFFVTIPSDQKIYCSHSCAAKVNNKERGPMPEKTKMKIAYTLRSRKSRGLNNSLKGIIKVARVKVICANPKCKRVFLMERWMKRKFCSNKCVMAVVGGRPTSPRAARGKAGIRKDVSDKIYFYSRWEANIARLFNFFGVKWEHQPKTFDLISQNYTPDFYLPEEDVYIEIKNFLWKYSKIRDRKFRKLYPEIKLHLLLKEEYLKLEKKYSRFVKNWEYRNSHFFSEKIIKPLSFQKI